MHASTISKMEVTPILVSVPQAAQMLGRGISTIYDLIARGEIEAKKSDGRTLLMVESLQAYARGLPRAMVAPPRERPPQRMRQAETANA